VNTTATNHDTARDVRDFLKPLGWRAHFLDELSPKLHKQAIFHNAHGWADVSVSQAGEVTIIRPGGESGPCFILEHSFPLWDSEAAKHFPFAMRRDFAIDFMDEICSPEFVEGDTPELAGSAFVDATMHGLRGEPSWWTQSRLALVPENERFTDEQLAAIDAKSRDRNGRAIQDADLEEISRNGGPSRTNKTKKADSTMPATAARDAHPIKAVPPRSDRPTQSNPSRRYELRTADELARAESAPYRVKQIFLQESIAAIYGASSSGKTFLGLDIAFAISDGREWFGHRVTPCDVLYIALEGESGQAQRVKAYRERHGADAGQRLKFITSPFSLLFSDDATALIATIAEAGIQGGVIIIDTLNAATPGMDENTSADMGAAIAATKRIREECGGLVILIHHTGKDATKGLRGHSSLPAALDSIIEVIRDGDRRLWRVAKSKDGEDGAEIGFRLEVLEVGEDEDGDPVTSCVVVHDLAAVDSGRSGRLPKGGNQRLIWDALGPMFTASPHFGKAGAPPGRPCLELEGAVAALRDRLTCDPKRKAERVRAALGGLVNRGALKLEQGWLWCS
jgi:hypothetical protein